MHGGALTVKVNANSASNASTVWMTALEDKLIAEHGYNRESAKDFLYHDECYAVAAVFPAYVIDRYIP